MTNNITEDLSAQIEGDLIALLDDWASLGGVWDDELDSQIHQWYVNPPKVWPQKPYFSPSSLGSCPRELYLKARGAEKDSFRKPPHQRRQADMGTLTGDYIQRELLFIEKHYEKLTGNAPKFRFLRDDKGRPRFEEFAKANVRVSHNGETFHLSGSPDGIMEYTTDAGEKIRVGLEVKSKASTSAKTSNYSMREPDAKHIVQTQCYAKMYGCDYYVILYVNLAKKGWFMSDEDYAKTPDIRAFCLHVTEEDKLALLDKPAEITKAVREGTPPLLDLDNWTFNSFKTACALDLSAEEFDELVAINHRMQHSNLKAHVKRDYAAAIEFITETRKGAGL